MIETETASIHATIRYSDGQSESSVSDNRGAARQDIMRRLARAFVNPEVVSILAEVR